MGCSKSSSKKEVYSDTGLPEKNKKNLKQPNLPSEGIRKRRTNPRVSRRKEMINIIVETNRDLKSRKDP